MSEQEVTTEPRWKAAGPPYLLTRDELLEELNSQNVFLSDRQIRSWVTYGILDRPVRRVPPGMTDGRPYALYPLWSVGLIAEYWRRIHKGQTIESLKEDADWLKDHWRQREYLFLPYAEEEEEDRRLLGAAMQDVSQATWKITTHLLSTNRVPVMRATLVLKFENGRESHFALTPYPPEDKGSR